MSVDHEHEGQDACRMPNNAIFDLKGEAFVVVQALEACGPVQNEPDHVFRSESET